MIDLMTRLKIHHMAEGAVPQAVIAERCGVGLRSVERIVGEPAPTRDEIAAGSREGASRRGRPPKADAVGFGEMRPILDNTTEEGRAENRRVEFIIVERQ